MEVKTYIRFFLKKWKTILAIFVVTFVATAILTFGTTPIYQTTTTSIVRLSALSADGADDRTAISAIDTLSNRVEIAATYARVAKSRLIKDLAAKELGLSTSQTSKLTVMTQILAGTNVLEITVEGSDPTVIRDYANMLGRQSVLYVQNLYEIYALEILDEAQLPSKPIKPNVANNLVLGGTLGLLLGFAFALLTEYLSDTLEPRAAFNILDEKTGTYNKRFFNLRLHQEINRARRNKGSLSVVLVNVDHRRLLEGRSAESRLSVMRNVISMFAKSLRDEDVMAPFSDMELALLLPDLDGKTAKEVVERLLESVSLISIELGIDDKLTNLHGAAGIAPFDSSQEKSMTTDEIIAHAQNALDSMKESTFGRVVVYMNDSAGNVQKSNKAK